jgi:DNA-binding NtrC family response regulator
LTTTLWGLRDVSEMDRLMARFQRSAEAARRHERRLRAADAEPARPLMADSAPMRAPRAVHRVEASMLRDALDRYGTQEMAARHLGVGQATVARKVRRYGLR